MGPRPRCSAASRIDLARLFRLRLDDFGIGGSVHAAEVAALDLDDAGSAGAHGNQLFRSSTCRDQASHRAAELGLRAKGIGMAAGTLEMWNAERCFGFIANDAGGPDVFLHIIALLSAGIDPDNPSQRRSADIRC